MKQEHIWKKENRSPTIAEYQEAEKSDGVLWWKLELGDQENLFEEALQQIDNLYKRIQVIQSKPPYDIGYFYGSFAAKKKYQDEISGLKAENERLRDAVGQAVIDLSVHPAGCDDCRFYEQLCLEVADRLDIAYQAFKASNAANQARSE